MNQFSLYIEKLKIERKINKIQLNIKIKIKDIKYVFKYKYWIINKCIKIQIKYDKIN